MNIRKPIVAGQFYPGGESQARAALDELLPGVINEEILPKRIVAGIVPHAGWVCSGAVAGKVFEAIKQKRTVDTFVLFGAVHHYGVVRASMFGSGRWKTPLGEAEIDQDLAEKILAETKLIAEDPHAHTMEHSLEVQVPFIQMLFPKAKILPIMVPPIPTAGNVGELVGRVILENHANAVCVGSSDLTHYGPSYGFTPSGHGLEGIRWAKDVNDKGLLDRIAAMDAKGSLEYAVTHQAACGSGAIAATIAAAEALGADTVTLLEHTNSYDVLREAYGEMGADAVGYAAIVFGKD
jgi:hypothetical protein